MLFAGLPLSGLVLKATEAIVSLQSGDTIESDDEAKPAGRSPASSDPELSALNAAMLDNPAQALANATREAVRMCETVEAMLARIIELYERAEQNQIDELGALDDKVDRRHAAIKLYLARIAAKRMSEDEAYRCQELLGTCVKLEQVGDIITRNLLAHVQKKMDRKVDFTEEGWKELSNFHAAVLANARLAFNLIVTGDAETARQLVIEKDRLRAVESEMGRRHFERLRQGTEKSVETSSLHLDTIRDLKQINSLFATIAYPALEAQGLLFNSRLKAVGN